VQTLTSSLALLMTLFITLSGAEIFARVYLYILLVLMLALLSSAIRYDRGG
jgi:hypothetical protein